MHKTTALLAGLAFASSLHAQSTPAARTTATDTDFVRKAGSAGLAEVALGKLAAERASSKDVKTFAARMVQDHSTIDDTLSKLAGAKGLQMAVAPEPAQQQDIDRIKSLQGAAFDQAYSDTMVRDHKLIIGLYELEANKGDDTDVRDFARATLPMLKSHEKLADDLPPF